MLVSHESLSDNAKIWVYPSSRKFYPQELDELKDHIENFLTSWKTEDTTFNCSYQLMYQRFIIFFVGENSTLSQDDNNQLVSLILKLQELYNIELLDRMNVCFKQGEFIQYKDIKSFKKMIKEKSVSTKTVVFDNLIQTKYDLTHYWELPITESWYNRFL